MGILIITFMSCSPKIKHFYLGYGQIGYLHSPTIEKDRWMTFEIKAPKYDEVE